MKTDDHERKMAEESEITCLSKQLDASIARIHLLEKENWELRQQVARLSSTTHGPQQKTSPTTEKNLEVEIIEQRSFFYELAARKERSLAKVAKPPSAAHASIKDVNGKKVPSAAAAPPPPPPLPSKSIFSARSVRRVPELVELYRLLTKKEANVERRANSSAVPVVTFNRNMIGEIENRSTYLSAIKSDVEKQKEFVNFLIKKVESKTYRDISDVEAFVKWLDGELSSLVDERAVLKHFPRWPERKADALREAVFTYHELQSLESEVSSFQDNPKETMKQALKKMQALQDRLEQSINNVERTRESTMKRYREYQIPWEWMMNSGLVGQVKLSSLMVAKECMKRISKQMQLNEENLLVQGVRFAYRIHQFAGGFDEETRHVFEELKKLVLVYNNKQ